MRQAMGLTLDARQNNRAETTMSLGDSLRQAREAKGLTLSQVAEATRMMVQVVEDLEHEDFRRIAAPIYGRGFIKLYAEHLDIDPEPLIREFMEIYTGSRPPQIARRPLATEDHSEETSSAPAEVTTDQPEPAESERPVIPASEAVSETMEPDLFSVAAGRMAAVRSIAEPSQPGDTTPPRVRPAASASTATSASSSTTFRPASASPRETPETKAGEVRHAASGRPLSASPLRKYSPAKLGAVVAGIVILLVLVILVVHAAHHKNQTSAHPRAPLTIQHALPPPAPYF